MKKNSRNHYDILIAGAGFAGSLTALALAKSGFKICLLEKGKHPRFAIGESSTPVADIILRTLSEKYGLRWLYDFSRYGSWQRSHPEIVCGIKRGFSFFKHYPGKEFTTDENHSNELLVAASSSDDLSDTNWLRSDIDSYLIDKVKQAGIDYFDLCEITELKRNSEWEFSIKRSSEQDILYGDFFIDASGSGTLAYRLLGIESSSNDFLTDSFALFSHFNNLPHWSDVLKEKGISMNDFPFDPDNSALHQMLDEGWMWMLRFNNERTSIGFVLDERNGSYNGLSTEKIWNDLSNKYLSIGNILKDAKLHSEPGKIIRTSRLQRKSDHCFGEGWVALPHSVGFVDPLFSSGIAFSLSGIEKLLSIFTNHFRDNELFYKKLEHYEIGIFEELKLMDCLIAGCYKTMGEFQLFNAWSMLYFTATIAHEQRRLRNEAPGYFLNADDSSIREIVYDSYDELLKINSSSDSEQDIKTFTKNIKERIRPFNTAGLLDPSLKNMYRHTAAIL